MDVALPGYYQSHLQIQEGFLARSDPTRRLPAVLEHLIKSERLKGLTEEISRLSPKVLEARFSLLKRCFDGIEGLEPFLLEVFERYFGADSPLNGCARQVKIVSAAAIVQAYPYEGIACFNPTIVPLPDPSGTSDGSVQVVLALRSYGEFHRSSITFRTGRIDEKGWLRLEGGKKTDQGFTVTCLPKVEGARITFPEEGDLNAFVVYAPFLVEVGETWEDIRFTPFCGDSDLDGHYLGTFTSFNFLKRRLQTGVLVTRDFRSFDYHLLGGSTAEDKDLAYFPRLIKGRYAMLSRNDGRDLFFMSSEEPFSWNKKKKIAECRPDGFDAHKMGVCAPPLETPEGWLVIYHGVADPGQIYSLGVLLLDLEDPTVVRARLPYTLHHPFADEPTGMLTTINYTCGAMIHPFSGNLIVPYACNDTFWKVGRIGLDELLARLMDDGRC